MLFTAMRRLMDSVLVLVGLMSAATVIINSNIPVRPDVVAGWNSSQRMADNFRPAVQATTAPATPIRYGDTVTGEFGQGDSAFTYTFSGDAGNLITITMLSSADNETPIDPAIQLLNPAGQLIGRNDGSLDPEFGLTNARILRFPLVDSGTYTIMAMRSSDTDGAFSLTLKATKGTAIDRVEYGKTLQGNITGSAPKATYQLPGSKGDVISATAQSQSGSKLIPLVILLGPDGDRLVTSDAKAKTITPARNTRDLLPDDGAYTVVVTRVGEDNGTTTGAFRLTVVLIAQNTIMAYGDTVQGTIDNDTTDVNFIFAATKGDLVTITMKRTDGDLASTLTLLGSDGKQITFSNKASGAGLKGGEGRIKRFRIPRTGNFTIVAGRKDGDSEPPSG